MYPNVQAYLCYKYKFSGANCKEPEVIAKLKTQNKCEMSPGGDHLYKNK